MAEKKVALIVGHNEKSKGAYSSYLGISEYDFYSETIEKLFKLYEKRFGVDPKKMKEIKEQVTIFRVPNTGYSKEMTEVVEKLSREKFDIAIELHFNAVGGNGTTVLYWHKSSKGKELADLFQEIMSGGTGVKKRELIPIKNSSQNGAYGIMNSKCPYVLLEPFFGDSELDCSKVDSDIIAEILFKYLNKITGVDYHEESGSAGSSKILDSITIIENELKKIKEELNVK